MYLSGEIRVLPPLVLEVVENKGGDNTECLQNTPKIGPAGQSGRKQGGGIIQKGGG